MRIKKPRRELNLQELRDEIVELREQGEKIISHYKKLDEYYADWQDRFYKIELKIQEVERETGLDKQEITTYDVLEDALNL